MHALCRIAGAVTLTIPSPAVTLPAASKQQPASSKQAAAYPLAPAVGVKPGSAVKAFSFDKPSPDDAARASGPSASPAGGFAIPLPKPAAAVAGKHQQQMMQQQQAAAAAAAAGSAAGSAAAGTSAGATTSAAAGISGLSLGHAHSGEGGHVAAAAHAAHAAALAATTVSGRRPISEYVMEADLAK